jgi:uncharacterized protein
MIIEETYNLLAERYGSEFEEIVISDVRVGLHLTGVVLSDNSCGTSATISYNDQFRSKSNRDFGSFTPLMIKGRRVGDLFNEKKDSGLIATLRSAVLNAYSSKLFFLGKYPIIENCDPVQLINFETPKTVTIVGAFQSYIRKIEPKCNKLNVLEFSESALDEKHRKYYVPASDYKKVIPFSDIIIITGQTLVNGTIDELLKTAPETAQIIVSGPTVSIIPDILFKNKVTMIGAMRITNSELMFDIVGQGGSGYHLFEYCAQKISILKSDERQA